jgi:UDP-N-acetyl-D-glucosamine dehydrogenase
VSVVEGTSVKQQLIEKIGQKTARIGVVGLGYVGLPFAVEKAKVGFQVTGIDRSPDRVAMVNRGENYIGDVDPAEFKGLVDKGLIMACTDFECVRDLDVIIICVPTPLDKNLTPDLQYIRHVASEMLPYLRPGQLISLESTTYPGTTEGVLQPILDKSGLKVDEEYFLVHSPERVDPGNARYTTKNTNKVVGGVGPNSLEVAMAFYQQAILNMVPVSSASAAELCKVFENTFRAVNIALVNELAILCDRMGLNVWEVLEAANTKPFGMMRFMPGPGVGGHCIPLDPHYLEYKAREFNFTTRFIGLAGEINRSMPHFTADKIARVLNGIGKAPSPSRILVLGVAYKRDIDDCRESPAMEVIQLLRDSGADVVYHDPHVPVAEHNGWSLQSEALTAELVAGADLVVITTEHSSVDYGWVVKHARVLLDTRNATKNVEEGREKITLL